MATMLLIYSKYNFEVQLSPQWKV